MKRNIVIFSPKFMGYENIIANEFQNQGWNVKLFDQRSVVTGVGKAISKKMPKLLKLHNCNFYKKNISSLSFVPDEVLVIQGDMIEKPTIDLMRAMWPKVVIRLYLWDSLSNLKGVSNKLEWFDKVFSFDRVDAEHNESINFLPLFFSPHYDQTVENHVLNYDVMFVGTIHSDRNKIVDGIFNGLHPNNKIFNYRYLPAKWLFFLYKIVKKDFRYSRFEDFNYIALPINKLSSLVAKAKVLVDINHPKQVGLTMRTFELLGMQKKMITTNADVVNYDFYTPENILVIDRSGVYSLPDSFIQTEFQPIDEEIRQKYSLASWVKQIAER